MRRKKKKTLTKVFKWFGNINYAYLIVALFLFLIILFALLLYRMNKAEFTKKEFDPSSQITVLENTPDNPIRKYIAKSGLDVMYLIKAKFVEQPYRLEDREDGVYGAKFVIDGDPLERQFDALIGMHAEEEVYFGRWTGDFQGEIAYKHIPLSELSDNLEDGEKVILKAYYRGEGFPDGIPEYILEFQSVMDKLLIEFKEDKYKYTPPEDFLVIINAIEAASMEK